MSQIRSMQEVIKAVEVAAELANKSQFPATSVLLYGIAAALSEAVQEAS